MTQSIPRRSVTAACLGALLAAPPAASHPADKACQTARHLEAIRHDPARLHMFLAAMPKGGDLHTHLGGAIYAEHYLAWARADHVCIDRAAMTLAAPPCLPDQIPADSEAGIALSGPLIDAMSMRDFTPSNAESAHDHFFASFSRFSAISVSHEADMLAQARNDAARQGLTYVEMMWFPGIAKAKVLAQDMADDADLPVMEERIAPALPALVRDISAHIDVVERQEASLLHCGRPDAQPGCDVTVRYMPYALRNLRPALVFAQASLGFALADADVRIAGINLVAPEDDPIALRDYGRHMAMFRFLEQRYPHVAVSLHAGELAPGLVPPEDLRFHIRAAVQDGGARRIGHGVAIAQEADAASLLRAMAARKILVEINLTSNDLILGFAGRAHPLVLYMAAHVPVALSTDDQGVSRSDITREYERAVQVHALRYADLKTMARNSLDYAFLPGASLWRSTAPYVVTTACRSPASQACRNLLSGSQKARLQADLERRLTIFETHFQR